jgi:hypothetical protein
MSTSEGIRRIVVAGRLIVLTGATLCALAYATPLPLAILGIEVMAFGGAVWLAGWIIEGFTQPKP